jgi:membrane protein
VKFLRKGWRLLREAGSEWSNDKAPRLGASLSYYTIFSLAPVLLLVIAVAGLALGTQAAQGKIVDQLSGLLGADAAKAIQTMLEKASQRGSGIVATVIGFVTLIVGATGVMIELQDALNTVWKVVPKPGRGLKGILRDRLLSFGIVLGFGFLLLVSLVLSAAVAVLDSWIGGLIPGWVVVGYVLSYGISLGLVALVLAAIFKVLPDVKMSWRDVWVGALVTSVLFHAGKFGISLYIGKASVASTFGAAGSLAVLLVWVYYSSQIVLYGAEFTRVYANRYGSHVVPDDNAIPVPETPLARAAMEKQIKRGELPGSTDRQAAR